MNKVKQYEIALSFKLTLFVQFIQPWKQRGFVEREKKIRSFSNFCPKTTQCTFRKTEMSQLHEKYSTYRDGRERL